MSRITFQEVAIVGVGLLGGSIGLAMKERGLAGKVVGIGRAQDRLNEALRLGAIDEVQTETLKPAASADLIILCTPVRHIVASLPEIMRVAKPGAIVTDVGSTKTSIVAAGEAAARQSQALFVGSHPMAGSEKSGAKHAKASLFEGANCFVTKTASTPLDAFTLLCRFWQALGNRIVVLRPQRHDELAALISHLPHLVAVALVRAVEASGEDKNLIRGIIGNGFRDMTRLAAGSSDMWEDICAENSQAILSVRQYLDEAISDVFGDLEGSSDALESILRSANAFRSYLDANSAGNS